MLLQDGPDCLLPVADPPLFQNAFAEGRLGCTEWAINSAMKLFTPNCYVEVGPDGVQAKVKALSMYRGVTRPYPHPRSEAYITGLAAYRGGQFQMEYAEAFEVVLRKY